MMTTSSLNMKIQPKKEEDRLGVSHAATMADMRAILSDLLKDAKETRLQRWTSQSEKEFLNPVHSTSHALPPLMGVIEATKRVLKVLSGNPSSRA